MGKFQSTLRNGVLYPLLEELDYKRQHYLQRKKEIEDLIQLLQMRVEAENEYSLKLFKISDKNKLESFKFGLISKEVESFKSNSRCKAKAS